MNDERLTEFDVLLREFVGRFRPSGVLGEFNADLVRLESTALSALDGVYSKLPGKFPPLYERMVLTYRWHRSEVGDFDIFGSPPGPALDGLLSEILRDSNLSEMCLPNGFIQFGSGPDDSYDPLCFDLSRKTAQEDFAIVRLDHERILCNRKIKIVRTVAQSFESLVRDIVSKSAE
jgi:hypothetical protein